MRLAACICICVFSLGVRSATAEFRAGAATAAITPVEWPVQLIGSFSERLADKAFDPLMARAIVLDDGETKLAIVIVDNCLVDRVYFDHAKRRIKLTTGILTDHILCAATHTHSAPPAKDRPPSAGFAATATYMARLTGGIVEAVTKANENLEPAEMAHGVVAVPQEVFNRRWYMKLGGIVENPFGKTDEIVRMNPPRGKLLDRPAGPTDPDVNFLSFRALDGRPIALLANYSLHYVGGIPAGGVSADYFGQFARLIEEQLGAREGHPDPVAMMSNGTSGDVNNISFLKPRPRSEPLERMRAVAKLVAERVMETHETVDFKRDISLDMGQQILQLNKRKPTEEQIAWAKEVLATEDESKLPRLAKSYAGRVLHLSQPPHTADLVLQSLRIGSVGITAIPCEVFCEIGLEIKEKSPLKNTFTIELANGHYAYLPTPRQHKLGGYETWLGTCILEETASDKITATCLELLGEVAER